MGECGSCSRMNKYLKIMKMKEELLDLNPESAINIQIRIYKR